MVPWKISLIAIVFLGLQFSCQENLEDLLKEKSLQDSIANNLPEIVVLSPLSGATGFSPLVIQHQIKNWEVKEGGRNIQVLVNGENQLLSYNPNEVILPLDTGRQTIKLVLAHSDFEKTLVFAEFEVFILPQPDSLHLLTVVSGTGSGLFAMGRQTEIQAEIPEFRSFKKWVGDSSFVVEQNQETTLVIMPDKDITVEANFEITPVLYSDIEPLFVEHCDACHSGLNQPNLLSCLDLKENLNEVLFKIRDQSDPMPPTGLMPESQLRLIEEWATQGGKCN